MDAKFPAISRLTMPCSRLQTRTARQIFDDPAGDHDWGFSAEIDLDASDEAGAAVVRITEVGQL